MPLAPSLLLAIQTAVAPAYWGNIAPGPHAVGFTQRWVIDSTRRLPKGAEQYGLHYRPVLLNLWYPATRATGRPMRYDDYFAGAVRSAGTSRALARYAAALDTFERRIAWRELAKTERDSTTPELARRIEALFASPTFAHRDAPRAPGPHPVVVYTQGSQSSMDDDVVLCEYLASRGFIVVGSAFPREDNSDFTTSASDESRPRDIRRLLMEVRRLPGLTITSTTVVGHSAGAQAMLAFTTDPSAPIDALLSLDTTEDYSTLSDRLWAYFTDRVVEYRTEVKIPIAFVAGPEALFELADSLSATTRWLVTVPALEHNDFISQGNIRRQLLAGLPGGDVAAREAAARSYRSLVAYIAAWIEARDRPATATAPVAARPPLAVTIVPPGERFPRVGSSAPRTARETRHLFATADPVAFADLALRARGADSAVANNQVLMMLLVDAIRRGAGDRARSVYDELVRRDSTVRGVTERIRDRAALFDRIRATKEAEEWRGMLRVLEPGLRGASDSARAKPR